MSEQKDDMFLDTKRELLRTMIKMGSYQAAVELAIGDKTGTLADFVREPLEEAARALQTLNGYVPKK